MRLLDDFTAPLIYLQSPLSIDECSDRINAAVGCAFSSDALPGAACARAATRGAFAPAIPVLVTVAAIAAG